MTNYILTIVIPKHLISCLHLSFLCLTHRESQQKTYLSRDMSYRRSTGVLTGGRREGENRFGRGSQSTPGFRNGTKNINDCIILIHCNRRRVHDVKICLLSGLLLCFTELFFLYKWSIANSKVYIYISQLRKKTMQLLFIFVFSVFNSKCSNFMRYINL